MVTTAAAVQVVAVVMTALDLDHRVILRGERRDSQSGGSGGGHSQRCEQRETNQSNAFHAVLLPSQDCDIGHNFPLVDLLRMRKKQEIVMLAKFSRFSNGAQPSRFTISSGMSGNLPPRSW
jgi:hypothetical protein